MTGGVEGNKTVVAYGEANADGDWTATIPFPTVENSDLEQEWAAGESHWLRLVTGSVRSGDKIRTEKIGFDLAEADSGEPGDPDPEELTITRQPENLSVANGAQAPLEARAAGGAEPISVQWQRSSKLSASQDPDALNGNQWIDIDRATSSTFTFNAGTNPNQGNRWYRTVFTDAEGATVTSNHVKLAILPVPTVATNPIGQTIRVGEKATFSAAATATDGIDVQWQSNTQIDTNGEPIAAGWTDIDGANDTELQVEGTDLSQQGTFYRAVFSNESGQKETQPAQLRFTELLDTTNLVTVSGESYGPVAPNQPFSVSAPNAFVRGEPIAIEGNGYLHPDGAQGSVASFLVDAGYSGDPLTLSTTRSVINPVDGKASADKRLHEIAQAGADGKWRVEIPWPDETNTNKDADFFAQHWQKGSQHSVRILSGTLLSGDYQRGITVRFAVVDEPTEGEVLDPAISVTNSDVEQYGDVWFNLARFTADDKVSVELANAAGETVAESPFVIGADGNTANPDGQTYRKILVPRDAEPGEYTLRVRDTDSQEVIATSGTVTVAQATTRVFNPGDHAGGTEDTAVQRGGTWTFHAVNFAPDGKLTATAEIDGETTELDGLGQIDGEQAWQLDANGDTTRDGFTRVKLPTSIGAGELEVTFTDGTRAVKRALTVEQAEEASVTVAESAELGGTLRVTGIGFNHPDGTGSKAAIKLDEGAYSRLDTSVHQNKTIWYIVEADDNGDFSIDMPIPNGTGTDDADAGTLGTSPAFTTGEHSLRFLTGNLKDGDKSRTLKSEPFQVTEAAEPEPEPAATTATVRFSAPSFPYNSGRAARITVVSANPLLVPTGKASVRIDGKTYTSVLKNGTSSIRLARPVSAGTQPVKVAYRTDDADAFKNFTKEAVTKVKVTKATPKVSIKLSSSKVKTSKNAKITVKTHISGSLGAKAAKSKVTIYDKGKVIKTTKLNASGTITAKLPKLKKGSHSIKVKIVGNSNLNSVKSSAKKITAVK